MTTFINTVTPYLRILMSDGSYIQFHGGSLDVAEDDEFYDEVLAEAQRNPSISIMVNATTCRYCGESFSGDKAKAKFESHFKDVHFDLWQKQTELDAAVMIQKEVKARAGYACDVCAPVQTFGSEGDLAEHVTMLHTQPPQMDDDGNTLGGEDGGGRRPGEVDPPPAATRSRNR